MVDFNSYGGNYGAYGRYMSISPVYGGYDQILGEVAERTKGSLFKAQEEKEPAKVSNAVATGTKIGIATAIGVGLVLAAKGHGKQALEIVKKPFKDGKIAEWTSKIFKKAPVVV